MAAGSLTMGGNLSVAVGPLGRNAEGSGSLSTKGKAAAMFSYSKTKGLFGGVSIEGSVIVERQDANCQAYGENVSSKQLLGGIFARPEWSENLIDVLTHCTGVPGNRPWVEDSFGRFDSRDNDSLGDNSNKDQEEYEEYDDYGYPIKKKKDSRKRADTLPRSSSYSDYAFGDTAASSNGRLRSGSGSLKERFSPSSSLSIPKRWGGGGASPLGSPSGSRRSSTLNPFGSRSVKDKDANPFGDNAAARIDETDPFDSYSYNEMDDTLGTGRPRSGSGLSRDMDLSGETISPWNNAQGLAPSRPTYDARSSPSAEQVASATRRYRSSSVATPAVHSPLRDHLDRDDYMKSHDTYRSSRRGDLGGSDPDENDLTARMGRMRASTNASQSRRSSGGGGGEYRSSPRAAERYAPRNNHYNDYDMDDVIQRTPQRTSTHTTPTKPKNSSSGGMFSKGRRSRANTGGSDFHVDPLKWQRRGEEEFSGSSTPPLVMGAANGETDPYFFNVVEDDFATTKSNGGAGGGSGGRPKLEQRPTFTVRKELLEAEKDGLLRAIALFDFAGQESGDLGFNKGDVLVVTKQGRSQAEW